MAGNLGSLQEGVPFGFLKPVKTIVHLSCVLQDRSPGALTDRELLSRAGDVRFLQTAVTALHANASGKTWIRMGISHLSRVSVENFFFSSCPSPAVGNKTDLGL